MPHQDRGVTSLLAFDPSCSLHHPQSHEIGIRCYEGNDETMLATAIFTVVVLQVRSSCRTEKLNNKDLHNLITQWSSLHVVLVSHIHGIREKVLWWGVGGQKSIFRLWQMYTFLPHPSPHPTRMLESVFINLSVSVCNYERLVAFCYQIQTISKHVSSKGGVDLNFKPSVIACHALPCMLFRIIL